MELTEQDAARFWWKTRKAGPDDCWVWIGTIDSGGYGRIGIGGRTYNATHVSLELSGRPRPPGLFALHACDNRSCVNPRHLRWGTQWENMLDAFERKRLPRKLTDEQARAILADGRRPIDIAKDYGCSPTTVSQIKARTRYKYL